MGKIENNIIENLSITEKIKNRNNILKIVVVLLFSILIAYKLGSSEITFDFSKFNFSDLLSLIVALFAVTLSVAFYFKATDTSNKFYDNTYKFTKDISEILGRIEAGFGERLRHLDEGYSGFIEKFDGTSNQSEQQIESAKKELEEEKKKLEIEMKEKNEIISDVMEKTKLTDIEKQEVLDHLKEKENEIANLSKELMYSKRQLSRIEDNREKDILNKYPENLEKFVLDFFRFGKIDKHLITDAPIPYVIRKLRFEREHFPNLIFEKFIDYNFINNNGEFTATGVRYLRAVIRKN